MGSEMPALQIAESPHKKNRDEPEPTNYEDDPRWHATLRITKSEPFLKAARLCQFLLYISERTLTGRLEEITEQQIGVHVFGKSTTYNPSDDTIVRATARQLRQRLAVYYQETGSRESIKVTIPRGGYVPVFLIEEIISPDISELPKDKTAIQPRATSEIDSASQNLSARRTAERRWRDFGLGALVGFALVLPFYLKTVIHRSKRLPTEALWDQLFTGNRETLIVPGDAGLNIFENLSRHEVDLNEYASHSYLKNSYAQTPLGYSWDPLATRTYTTVQNLRLAAQLNALPQARSSMTKIRFARELTMDDLKESNAILLGSPQYNPWEHLIEKDLNFTIHYDGTANVITVENRLPRQGEQKTYTWAPFSSNHIGYALITLTNNLSGNGKILLVQGTTAAGDDAAGDFLLSQDGISTALKSVEDHSHRLQNFQLLIETTLIGGDSHASRVIATRVF
jgi:hypothetical protein